VLRGKRYLGDRSCIATPRTNILVSTKWVSLGRSTWGVDKKGLY